MDVSFYTSPMSEEIREQGREQGRREGVAAGWAWNVLRLLELRGIAIPDEARKEITGCNDLDLLGQWLSRALTATTADEIFAAK